MFVTSIGDNPQAPYGADFTYSPDQLIGGNLKVVTDPVTITGGAALPRGAVLGQVAATGAFRLAVASATDGSQAPSAILVDAVDASAADAAGAVYLMAEVNGGALVFDPSFTLAAIAAALRPLKLIVKGAVSASDPT